MQAKGRADVEGAPERRPLLPQHIESFGGHSPVAPLQRHSGFNSTYRPYRDVTFAVLFVTALVAVAGIGTYAALHRNPHFFELNREAVLDDPANCKSAPPHRFLFEKDWTLYNSHFKSSKIAEAYVVPVIGAAVISFLLGFVFLGMLQACPTFMVYSTVAAVVLAPLLVAAVYTLADDDDEHQSLLIVPGALSLMTAAIFFFIRGRLQLTARLLRTAATALHANLRLLWLVPVVNIVQGLLAFHILALAAVSYTNGHLVPNPKLEDPLQCGKHGDPCCAWQPHQWVQPFMGFCGVVFLWVTILAFQVRLFTVAGTVSQWYFADMDQTGSSSVSLSLRHALGPSFGTLCFSSLVAAVVQIVRDAAQRAREQRGGDGVSDSAVMLFLTCCLDCLLSVIDFVTKFSVINAAITGENFCTAARDVFDLLVRNALSTVVVDSVAGWVLGLGTFVMAVACGVAAGAFSYWRWDNKKPPGIHSDDDIPMAAVIMGAVCYVVAQVILTFFSSVMLNVVETVYVCYAKDRDLGFVSSSEVHEVYAKLPSVKSGNDRAGQGQLYPPVVHPGWQPTQQPTATQVAVTGPSSPMQSNEPAIGYPAGYVPPPK